MKVLITGGNGFIGAWIIRRLLKRGFDVRILSIDCNERILQELLGPDVKALDWHVGDVSRREDVDAAAQGCQSAIHLAGILTPDCRTSPVRGAEINLIGTLNMFEAGLCNGFKKLVYCSSAAVFGPDDGRIPRPVTHYGAFKLACEGSARAYWEDHNFPSIGFRPFIIYGPGRETGVSAGPSLACRAAVNGEAYTIPFTGPAGFIYVDDVAAAFEAALLHDSSGAQVFNLPGEVATVADILREIRRYLPGAELNAAGQPLPIASILAADDLYEVFANLKRTTLAEGIAATIRHYRAHEQQESRE